MTQGQTRPQRLCPLGIWLLLRSLFPFPQATPSSPVRLCHWLWGSQGGCTHRSFQKLPEPPPAHPMVLGSVPSCTWARPLLPHLQTRSRGRREDGLRVVRASAAAPPRPLGSPGRCRVDGVGQSPSRSSWPRAPAPLVVCVHVYIRTCGSSDLLLCLCSLVPGKFKAGGGSSGSPTTHRGGRRSPLPISGARLNRWGVVGARLPGPGPHLPAAGQTRDRVHRCVYFDGSSSYFCGSV